MQPKFSQYQTRACVLWSMAACLLLNMILSAVNDRRTLEIIEKRNNEFADTVLIPQMQWTGNRAIQAASVCAPWQVVPFAAPETAPLKAPEPVAKAPTETPKAAPLALPTPALRLPVVDTTFRVSATAGKYGLEKDMQDQGCDYHDRQTFISVLKHANPGVNLERVAKGQVLQKPLVRYVVRRECRFLLSDPTLASIK